ALAVAGRVADGVIIQLADPVIIQWIMDTARRAAQEAGRDPGELKCIVGAPSHISDDLADAREQSRWFPAMVSNHVMDLIERYGEDSEIPKDLTDYVKARKFYDYREHSRGGAKHGEFVSDEIVDRFSVLGRLAPAVRLQPGLALRARPGARRRLAADRRLPRLLGRRELLPRPLLREQGAGPRLREPAGLRRAAGGAPAARRPRALAVERPPACVRPAPARALDGGADRARARDGDRGGARARDPRPAVHRALLRARPLRAPRLRGVRAPLAGAGRAAAARARRRGGSARGARRDDGVPARARRRRPRPLRARPAAADSPRARLRGRRRGRGCAAPRLRLVGLSLAHPPLLRGRDRRAGDGGRAGRVGGAALAGP